MPETRPLILIVDDHRDLADSVCELLTMSGHRAIAVYSANQAIGATRVERPEIAILDFRIGPGLNGVALLGELRKIEPNITGILMTSDQEYETALSSIRAGIFDYVRKPAEPEQLLAAIGRAVALCQSRRGQEEEFQQLDASARGAEANRSLLRNLGAELREPLSIIVGYAELIAAHSPGIDIEAASRDVRASVQQVLASISLANELTRHDPGDEDDPAQIDVNALLHEVRERLRDKARACGMDIEVSVPDAAVILLSHRAKLRRALLLLADSFLAFAGPGAKLGLEADGGSGAARISTVLVTGRGGRREMPNGLQAGLSLLWHLDATIDLHLSGGPGAAAILTFPEVVPQAT